MILAAAILAEVYAADIDLIYIHVPSTHLEVAISIGQITSIHSTKPKGSHTELTDEARCAIALADGKFISSVESCEKVTEMIRELKK